MVLDQTIIDPAPEGETMRTACLLIAILVLGATAVADTCAPYVIVLGIAQDGGSPQAGTKAHPGWDAAGIRIEDALAGVASGWLRSASAWGCRNSPRS